MEELKKFQNRKVERLIQIVEFLQNQELVLIDSTRTEEAKHRGGKHYKKYKKVKKN